MLQVPVQQRTNESAARLISCVFLWMLHRVCSHMYIMRYWKPELIPCARKWMTHFFCWSSKPLCSHYSPFPLRLGFDDSVVLTVSLRVTEPHLCWTVEEARRGSLWLRVGQLHRELEAQREVTGHEEPGHANTHRITDTHTVSMIWK